MHVYTPTNICPYPPLPNLKFLEITLGAGGPAEENKWKSYNN